MASLSEQDLARLDFAVAMRTWWGSLSCGRPRRARSGAGTRPPRWIAAGHRAEGGDRVAFERLPNLLLTAFQSPPVGVMVARGDLAVEMGFERLAEVQEQILWLCEAAKRARDFGYAGPGVAGRKGLPSRAEVTDAAMSGRASASCSTKARMC